MKTLLINGSPNEAGCTFTALSCVAEALEDNGIDTEIAWIGRDPIRGCIGCGGCAKKGDHRCIFDDDVVNSLLDKAEEADAYVFGSPVYFAGPNGAMKSVMDRMFYAASTLMAFKPAAAVTSARRAGTTATLECLQKFINFNRMPLVGSYYWPMVHGRTAEEAVQDLEGMATMKQLGNNMAWIMQCIESGKAAGHDAPHAGGKPMTNFIR